MINCIKHIRTLLFILILGLSSQTQAGEPLMVVQSSTHRFAVKLHEQGGTLNTYDWTVTRRESGGLEAIESIDYKVIARAYAGVNEVYIQWLKEGNYDLHVIETSAVYGCQVSKKVAVDVIPNTEAYTLEQTAFESCFGDERELNIAISTFMKDDETLADKYFPLKVNVKIYNGSETKEQVLEISNPGDNLVIEKQLEDEDNKLTYVITLTEITDRFGTVLKAQHNDNMIVYTIYSKPRISFTSN